jgi:hypothetical protein
MGAQPGGLEEFLAHSIDKLPALPEDLELYARVEGLMEAERALLDIPRSNRTDQQHRLLGAISAELDRVFEKLRLRAAGK